MLLYHQQKQQQQQPSHREQETVNVRALSNSLALILLLFVSSNVQAVAVYPWFVVSFPFACQIVADNKESSMYACVCKCERALVLVLI